MKGLVRPALLLVIVSVCLLAVILNSQNGTFRGYQTALLSADWMLLTCLVIWCGAFIFLMFSLIDLPLIGLLISVLVAFFISHTESLRAMDAIVFLAGVTMGKGARFALKADASWQLAGGAEKKAGNQKSEVGIFLNGLVVLLAFSSWWHLNLPGAYHGPRWMGLWDNPNTYGMLMGAGGLLAIGLHAANSKLKIRNSKLGWFLGIAAFMLGVGLVMSYSRGAWLGAAVGLLYLGWSYGKLKWRHVLPSVVIVALAAWYFWGSTPDSAPWYVKRADLGRPSAQHRASAWRAGLEMMRDHPFGVGCNNAVKTYQEHYNPPEDGAAAITTNDYLMIGTELGIPALLCFVAYVALCYRKSPRPLIPAFSPKGEKEETAANSSLRESEALRAACLAGALVFVVAFWFDGGLFKLPTAALFWVLLELGAYRTHKVEGEKFLGCIRQD